MAANMEHGAVRVEPRWYCRVHITTGAKLVAGPFENPADAEKGIDGLRRLAEDLGFELDDSEVFKSP